MTNEEAIGEMYYLTHKTDDKKALDALDMATKALEQQPCEDCVSRAEVYDIITRLFTSVEMTNEAWKEVMELVKELPSVKPKQKAGKWILKNDMYGMWYRRRS